MTPDMSFFHLVANASIPVQAVMLMLVIASVMSWTMIFKKRVWLNRAKRAADDFEEHFWSLDELTPLYQQISANRDKAGGMELLFEAGFREFARLQQKRAAVAEVTMEGVQRAMRIALNKEVEELETHLSFLASVGSTSPYVGLFGTVWGIMNSFRALGNVQQASISMVAPGIAEALIATAMGLFAAIPAVIAYNRFSNDVERLVNRYDTFMEEFSAILHHQAHS